MERRAVMKDFAVIKITLAALVPLVLGCGGYDAPTQPGDTGNSAMTVAVTNNQFSPSTLSVPVNSTVTWQWNSGGVAHNVTFQDGPTSGDLGSGSFPRTFATAGSYAYVCTIHAAEGMTGVVNVTTGTGGGGGGGGGTGGGGGYP
jgi:plastocyanin